MPSIKPVTIAARMEQNLADDFRTICDAKHIAPSTMLRVLVHRFVEECGFQPDPLAVIDAEARENQKRKPRTAR
jgi:hypothetical protein